MPQFQVFFNDQASNDFNTLFISLPKDRQYFAAGVPGSFYGRLFPESSIHFAYSATSIHWLSKVPEELRQRDSPAWNKGRIHYTSASDEVIKAYKSQFAEDMENFLTARAKEIVSGGMIAIIVPSITDGVPFCQTATGLMFNCMASCLMDMVKLVSSVSSKFLIHKYNINHVFSVLGFECLQLITTHLFYIYRE